MRVPGLVLVLGLQSDPAVTSLIASAAAGMLTLLALSSQTTAATWEELEARKFVISGVEIVVNDVFDLSRPSENNWISKLANAAHVETRDRVVARELLFASGEPVDAERIRETERNLRRHAFIRDARIVPVRVGDSAVTARVEIDDAWSLLGNVDLTQTGGNLEWSARVDEVNLLGTGKRVFFEHEENIERSANEFGYVDPQFLGSRWVLSAAYGDLSDGSSRVLLVERPYFSIETPYAVGGFITSSDRLLTQYNHGEAVNVIPARRTSASAFCLARVPRARPDGVSRRAGVPGGRERVRRAGGVRSPDCCRCPTHRRAACAACRRRGAWCRTGRRHFENLARIGRTEDYNLGWALSGCRWLLRNGVGERDERALRRGDAQKGMVIGLRRA